MIYTAIDTFYLSEEQLKISPSSKDGINEATENTLRIYGCDLIQECGILLKLYPFTTSSSVTCFFVVYCLGIMKSLLLLHEEIIFFYFNVQIH